MPWHDADPDAVGIDVNFVHGAAACAHPVMADAQHVPMRDGVADHIRAHSILEHLPDATSCLDDMHRIMRPGATGSVLLPVEAYLPRQILRRFLREFPFSAGWVLGKLWRSVTLWRRCPEMVHCTQVRLGDLGRYFEVGEPVYRRRLHKWFVHAGPFTLLARAGLVRRLTVDEYADFTVEIAK